MNNDEKEVKIENENTENGKKKISIRKLLIIIGSIILAIVILFFVFRSSIIISKKDLTMNDENVNYLTSKYGENKNSLFSHSLIMNDLKEKNRNYYWWMKLVIIKRIIKLS